MSKLPNFKDFITESDVSNMSDLERAAHAVMIELPANIQGTNCGNCQYFLKDYCNHHEIEQEVKTNWCCNYWFAEGTKKIK